MHRSWAFSGNSVLFIYLFKYDFMFSAGRMFMENNLDNYDVLCRKYIQLFKFMSRISSNNNILVSSLSNSSFFLKSTFFEQ